MPLHEALLQILRLPAEEARLVLSLEWDRGSTGSSAIVRQ
jgi:hypothetical protein